MVRQLPASLQADADAICPTDRAAMVLSPPHPPAGHSIRIHVPTVHEVHVTRRERDGRGLADWVQGRYLDHASAQAPAEACSGVLLDVLA